MRPCKAQSMHYRGASAARSTILRATATDVKCGRGTISAQAPRGAPFPGRGGGRDGIRS